MVLGSSMGSWEAYPAGFNSYFSLFSTVSSYHVLPYHNELNPFPNFENLIQPGDFDWSWMI